MSEQVCKHCEQEIVIAAKGRGGAGFWRLSRSGQIFDGTHYHEPSPGPEVAPECNTGIETAQQFTASLNTWPPASEAEAPAAPERDYSEQAERDAEKLAEGYRSQHRFGDGPAWYAACVTACREVASLRERLEKAEARVAILDAQEVEPGVTRWQLNGNAVRSWLEEDDEGMWVTFDNYLDALRAVQAKNELLRIASEELQEQRNLNGLPPLNHIGRWEHKRQMAYDALAGKGE